MTHISQKFHIFPDDPIEVNIQEVTVQSLETDNEQTHKECKPPTLLYHVRLGTRSSQAKISTQGWQWYVGTPLCAFIYVTIQQEEFLHSSLL